MLTIILSSDLYMLVRELPSETVAFPPFSSALASLPVTVMLSKKGSPRFDWTFSLSSLATALKDIINATEAVVNLIL